MLSGERFKTNIQKVLQMKLVKIPQSHLIKSCAWPIPDHK